MSVRKTRSQLGSSYLRTGKKIWTWRATMQKHFKAFWQNQLFVIAVLPAWRASIMWFSFQLKIRCDFYVLQLFIPCSASEWRQTTKNGDRNAALCSLFFFVVAWSLYVSSPQNLHASLTPTNSAIFITYTEMLSLNTVYPNLNIVCHSRGGQLVATCCSPQRFQWPAEAIRKYVQTWNFLQLITVMLVLRLTWTETCFCFH